MARLPLLSLRSLAFPGAAALSLALLTGCGAGPIATSISGTLSVSGTVHGGQQPVSGSTISLYTAGNGGNGTAAHSMLTRSVHTDGDGYFSITAGYTCNSPTDQVYIVSSGGNPGLSTQNGPVNNNALVLVDALGNCSNLLTPGYYISINEITTAAAAWALAPFMTSSTNTASSSTNATGLANAFLDAQLLANPVSGGLASLPSNLKVESNKLLALADAIAPCINSDGTTACDPLFAAATPSGGAKPGDTLTAALNIVRNPGQHVTDVWNCILPSAPFPTKLKHAPNDWTMSLTVSSAGFYSPAAFDIDSAGNVWVIGQNNPLGNTPNGLLQAFSPQGTPFSASGYGSGTLSDSFGITIDTSGYVWVTNWESPSHGTTKGGLTKFTGASSATPGTIVMNSGSPYFYDNSLDYPTSIAADPNGNLDIANYGNSTASVYSSSTNALAPGYGGLGYNSAAYPVVAAADNAHGFWLANSGDNTITHIASDGSVQSNPACCSQTYGLAVDSYGNAWAANYGSNSVSEVSPTGAILIQNDSNGGVVVPSSIAVDAAQNIWVANYRTSGSGATISELAGNGGTLAAGTGISPAATANSPGGYGLDANLLIPQALHPDASGNLWVSNNGNDDMVMFFGLAAPTATPLIGVPAAP